MPIVYSLRTTNTRPFAEETMTATATASAFDKAKSEIGLMARTIRLDPVGPVETLNQGDLLRDFRYFLDVKDELDKVLKKVEKVILGCKQELIDRSISEGTDSFSCEVLSASIKETHKVKITGDWGETQQFLIENGLGGSIQRRLSDKQIVESWLDGELRLPEGLEITTFRTATQRRKN